MTTDMLFPNEPNEDEAHSLLYDNITNGLNPAETTNASPIRWLLRTYETTQTWKRKASDILFSVNGDSDVARNRVATIVRTYFIETDLQPEEAMRWKRGENTKEHHRFIPPKVTASNASYIDWVYIADFLLLACRSSTDELESENTLRNMEFDNAMRSYLKRVAVESARELIKQNASLTDDDVKKSLSPDHPDITLAAVKIARKMEKENITEPKAMAPTRPAPMPTYTALYFPDSQEIT